MKNILILDTETTGISNHPTRGHPEIIEMAYFILEDLKDFQLQYKDISFPFYIPNKTYTGRFKPSMSIQEEAFKIHGISYRDLLTAPCSTKAILPEDTLYLIGHNIQYDHRCLGKPEVKLICTMGLAKFLKKKLKLPFDKVTLDWLIGYFYPEYVKELILPIHTSYNDCLKTALLLIKILEYFPTIDSWDALYQFQKDIKL